MICDKSIEMRDSYRMPESLYAAHLARGISIGINNQSAHHFYGGFYLCELSLSISMEVYMEFDSAGGRVTTKATAVGSRDGVNIISQDMQYMPNM